MPYLAAARCLRRDSRLDTRVSSTGVSVSSRRPTSSPVCANGPPRSDLNRDSKSKRCVAVLRELSNRGQTEVKQDPNPTSVLKPSAFSSRKNLNSSFIGLKICFYHLVGPRAVHISQKILKILGLFKELVFGDDLLGCVLC